MNKKIVNILTGDVEDIAFEKTTSSGAQVYLAHQMTKKGTPDLRSTPIRLGYRFARYNPEIEKIADGIRSEIAAMSYKMDLKKSELMKLYDVKY